MAALADDEDGEHKTLLGYDTEEIVSYAPAGMRKIVKNVQLNPSPQMMMYEDVLNPFLTDVGNSAAIQMCGFRSIGWFENIKRIVENEMASSEDLNKIRPHLSRNELITAQAFADWRSNSQQKFMNDTVGCDRIKDYPLASQFDLLRLGQIGFVEPRRYLTMAEGRTLAQLPLMTHQSNPESLHSGGPTDLPKDAADEASPANSAGPN